MPEMSSEHALEARTALHAIVTDPSHGAAVLSNPQIMSNLLQDLLPDAPREKSILVAAAAAGLADRLRGHIAGGMDASTAISLTSSSFSAATLFTPEACDWVTGEMAVALGISVPGDAGSAGAAARTSAPDPNSQFTQPPYSPRYQDPSYHPTAAAVSPSAFRPDQGEPSHEQATACPPGGGQASGGDAAPAAPPGWQAGPQGESTLAAPPGRQARPDGQPTPARRKRSTVVLLMAAVAVVAAGVTAAAILASGSTRSGTESFVSTSSYASGSPLALTMVGMFSATGTQTETAPDKWLARLPSGTFVVITKPQKASESVDSSTCVETIRQPGTYTSGDGTGKYSGITGSGTYHVVFMATLLRTSSGTCNTSRAVQGSVSWVVHGGGPITLP
jgi:hypothetical protein